MFDSATFDHLLKFFVTFLVVVEPVGVIPIFIAVTEGVAESERRRMARKGVLIAGGIFLVFAFGGGLFLRLLGISLDAFRLFGGSAAAAHRARDGVRARDGFAQLAS